MSYKNLMLSAIAGGVTILTHSIMRADNTAVCEGSGRITALSFGGDIVPVTVEARIALPQWRGSVSNAQWHVRNTRHRKTEDGTAVWLNEVLFHDVLFHIEQRLSENEGSSVVDFSITAEQSVDLAGIFLFINLPVGLFEGGICTISGTDSESAVKLPSVVPQGGHHLLFADGLNVIVESRDRGHRLKLTLDGEKQVGVQDNRVFKGTDFAVFAPFHEGRLARGMRAHARLTLTPLLLSGPQPAVVSLRPSQYLEPFEGVGGNYCFEVESPVTDFTLRTLPARWARTEMSLHLWEPRNDNNDPSAAAMSSFTVLERAGSELGAEFRLLQQLNEKGVRLVISAWHLPEWMYADPSKELWTYRRKLAPGIMPEVVESVVSYLSYVKQEFKVEPALFSFNEPDAGVCVLLSPREYADLAGMLASAFKAAGLRTKLLLGDVSAPERTDYVEETLKHREELAGECGALGFHSWNGHPDTFGAWRVLARRLRLPLMVTEVGVDPGAYRTPWLFDDSFYALSELRMYLELMQHARALNLLHWEYTADYGLATVKAGSIETGLRYRFVRQLAETPVDGMVYVDTESTEPRQICAAAFMLEGKKYLLHVANFGPERTVEITGFPGWTERFAVVRTEAQSLMQNNLPELFISGHQTTLQLPPWSLTTLRSIKNATEQPPAPP